MTAGENAKLAAHATTNVIRLPRNTYHVHAIAVAKNTYSIETMLTSIPINAGGWLTRRKNVPTRNTPRIGPLINDAIDNVFNHPNVAQVLEVVQDDGRGFDVAAAALYLAPTKALATDQLRAVRALQRLQELRCAVAYDLEGFVRREVEIAGALLHLRAPEGTGPRP